MRRLQVPLLLVLLCAFRLPAPASAQSDIAEPMGSLVLSAAPDGYEPFGVTDSFVLFEFFALVNIDFADRGAADQNATNGIWAYEFSFEAATDVIVVTNELVPPDALNFGDPPTEYIVGMGSIAVPNRIWTPLIRFQALILSEVTDVYLLPGPVDPATIPGVPAWMEGELHPENGCTNRVTGMPTRCIYPFARVEGMVINCTDLPACRAVTVEPTTWGAIKSRF